MVITIGDSKAIALFSEQINKIKGDWDNKKPIGISPVNPTPTMTPTETLSAPQPQVAPAISTPQVAPISNESVIPSLSPINDSIPSVQPVSNNPTEVVANNPIPTSDIPVATVTPTNAQMLVNELTPSMESSVPITEALSQNVSVNEEIPKIDSTNVDTNILNQNTMSPPVVTPEVNKIEPIIPSVSDLPSSEIKENPGKEKELINNIQLNMAKLDASVEELITYYSKGKKLDNKIDINEQSQSASNLIDETPNMFDTPVGANEQPSILQKAA